MGILKKMTGFEVERMPDISFRIMSFIFTLRDIVLPVGKKLDQFGIKSGYVVIDFGCGPGSYIEHASKLVGSQGKVFAVDIHPLAIKAVTDKAKKNNFANVVPVLSTGYPIDIESHSADIIYALDMFHHIKDTTGFLKELHRLLKPGGKLFLESGHQKMEHAREKIVKSGLWNIADEKDNMFVCTPTTGAIPH